MACAGQVEAINQYVCPLESQSEIISLVANSGADGKEIVATEVFYELYRI